MVITDDPIEPPPVPDLLPRACAGDADAFCLLIEALQSALFKQAVLLSGGSDQSPKDLVSETLVAA